MKQRVLGSLSLLILSFSLTGCNLWGGIDSPSGDAQLISAARACLDQGDFECAKNYYNKLSPSQVDIQQSELAFADLAEIGIGMEAFANAFGNGKNIDIGTALTTLANAMIPLKPDQTLRTRIYNDFCKEKAITDNPSLKALVKFLTGTTFAAEILAEMAYGDGSSQLFQTDISTNPSNCANSGVCNKPAASNIIATNPVTELPDTNQTLDSECSSTTNINVSPATLNQFMVSLKDIDNAIGVLGKAGSFGTSFSTFLDLMTSFGSDSAIRQGLLQQHVGN